MEQEEAALPADTLAALRQILVDRGDINAGDTADLATLTALLRGASVDDSSSDDDDNDEDDEPYVYVPPVVHQSSASAPEAPVRVSDPVALITVDDPYVRALVCKALRRRPHWQLLDIETTHLAENDVASEESCLAAGYRGQYHWHWSDYEHIDWHSAEFKASSVMVSCLYNRKGLVRKANLAHTMRKWALKRPGRPRIHPESFVLSLNGDGAAPSSDDLEAAISASGFPGFGGSVSTWILKPSVTNQANGIRIVQTQEQLATAVSEADELHRAGGFVLQHYIPPLIVDGRKFHLRVFVLVVGNIVVRVFPDFLALFSLETYADAPIDNLRAHLSNICHQRGSAGEGAALSDAEHRAAMRRWAELGPDLVRSGLAKNESAAQARISSVRERVMEVVAECMEAVTAELTFNPRASCFEIFGFDMMIDPDWNVFLLEANAEPDLSKAGSQLQYVVDRVVEEAVAITVDADPRFTRSGAVDNTDVSRESVVVFERAPRGW